MLSDFEHRYLRRNKRQFKLTRAEAIDALLQAGVPEHPTFIDFQSTYGGYCPDFEVTYGIVAPGEKYKELRTCEHGDQLLARIDLDNRMQIRMHIDTERMVYYEKKPVAESFESYICFNAYLMVTLKDLKWTYIDRERRETKRFREFFEKLNSAPIVHRASDEYHSVVHNDDYFEFSICDNRQLFVRPDLLA